MKIVIDINHPAQVHFLKNFMWEMQKRGHETLIAASDKDITYRLLNGYGFDFISMGSYGNSLVKKLVNIPLMDLKMYRAVKKFKADVFAALGSIRAAHVAGVARKPYIAFDDDEYSYPYYHHFAGAVCGFSGFKISGKKVVKLNSFKELAYLHPHYFQADVEVLKEAGISTDGAFVLLRFVAWQAYHDVGRRGFDLETKRKLVNELKRYAKVYISSETPLPEEFEEYRLPLPPEKIHHFLFFAKLLVCDSQTMTTEAGVLGTPVVRCNSFVGENDMGNFLELEQKYGLIFNCRESDKAISKAVELVRRPDLKEEWQRKREKLLADKIDATAFMVWFVENYPESFQAMKKNPEIQYRFR
ncbi:MAG: DUF354 domain-containing protein [Peptococcaceae bacterium]|nr:MAG: DUF354 domain-containing protein [Peptococcaceae bacterium]